MSVASLRSEDALAALDRIRVTGGVSLTVADDGARTRLVRLAESDGWRLRFPRGAHGLEGILVNTGGGIAGGDRVSIAVSVEERATLTLTSATAERIYRAPREAAQIDIDVQLASGAALALLPQETILHDGARLRRRVDVAMAGDARLTLADSLVFGRRAMPETMTFGGIDDQWRIRRNGALVHAEAVRLSGAIEDALQRTAIAAGACVVATVLHVAADAVDRLEAVRAALDTTHDASAAASAWDGKLVVRILAARADEARHLVAAAARILTGHATPRVWAT